MTNRTNVLPLGFGLSAVLCFSNAPAADEAPRPARPPVRVYTNEDLDRVHPVRSETGVDSVPAFVPALAPAQREPRAAARGPARGHGEEFWRREAGKVRGRMRTLVEQAETLRARIAAHEEAQRHGGRSGRRGSSATTATDTTALRARLVALEKRMRELEEDLADRARREGALPGWLR
jgi:hypothetical protein